MDKQISKILHLVNGGNNFNEVYDRQQKTLYELRNLTFNSLLNNDLNEHNRGGGGNNEKEQVVALIQNNQFEVNNYERFLNSLFKGKNKAFLSNYSAEDLQKEFKTFQLKGYDIGYAIKNDGDITSVFNNSNVRNIGKELIQSAISNGGKKLDHFDGFLSQLYEPLGFKEKQRLQWDDQYAPKDWDYDKFGRPDVVYRELE